jgi:hypothetical protein
LRYVTALSTYLDGVIARLARSVADAGRLIAFGAELTATAAT